jgi:UDP-N-acetylglucosamine transferase subunit ALG13
VTALVVALAGTDHHPFDRMVTWIDEAATRHPDVRFVVQHGSATRAPVVAEGHQFLTHDRLAALLAEATVVVCHGGPGTIMDAREAGHVPLCMPRDPRLGEHVDGHQQRFAALVGDAGVVRAVLTPEAFNRELDQALLGAPPASVVAMATLARDTARARLAAELDGLMTQRPHRLARRPRAPM